MKVNIFEPWYNEEHCELLRCLAQGIPGAEVHDVRKYVHCDVAVIFGMYKQRIRSTVSKERIIYHHTKHNRGPLLVLERGFVRRDEYYSLGWNGINGRADFCNDGMPGDRWDKLGVELQPWNRNGHYALVCAQVPWDVTVQDTNHIGWCQRVTKELKNRGYQTKFRPHPLARDVDYGLEGSTDDLATDLAGAQFVVTWNSNSAVDATVAGVMALAMNEGSMVWNMMPNTLEGSLTELDQRRERWANNIAYAQWTTDELKSGEAWEHLSRGL